jgi:NAD(P)-dependent dehydrogenase (short-subunit alcohol dehydrogenase family)
VVKRSDAAARDLRFDGNVIIVTGGAGGHGRSQAFELARRGARVVVNDLGGHRSGGGGDRTPVEAVAAEINEAGGVAIANADSVASEEGPRRMVEAAVDTWGRVDGIVTNAAIVRNRLFEDLTDEDWDEVVAVNMRGVFRTVQAAYRHMKNNGGRIVVMTSTAGLCGAYGQANYAASKTGLLGLVRSIAWEGRHHGIKANLVAPSASDHRYAANPAFSAHNPAHANRPPELSITADAVGGRCLTIPAQVTPVVLRLLHESCPVTGETYASTGGLYHRFATVATDGPVLPGRPATEDVAVHWDEIHGGRLPGELDTEVVVWGLMAHANRREGGSS